MLQRNRLPKIIKPESRNAITPIDDIYSKSLPPIKKKEPLPKIQLESRPIPAKIFEQNISVNGIEIEEKKIQHTESQLTVNEVTLSIFISCLCIYFKKSSSEKLNPKKQNGVLSLKKKVLISLIIIIIVAMVSIGVGLGVGLKKSKIKTTQNNS
jgi:hypothetical protein